MNLSTCKIAILTLATAGMWVSSSTQAQRFEFPAMPEMPGMDMGVIMDGTMFSSGSSMSVNMSIENGIKKIRATENGVKTFIEVDPNGSIVVKVTRQFGPEQMDILMEEHPDLYMSVKDFPSETEDAEAVEVTVGVTKKYEAASVEELQEKHPDAFAAYKKYSAPNSGGMQIFRGRFGGDLLMPEIRITPELREGFEIGIDPEDVRIHEDDEKPQAPKSEDKDT